LLTTYSLLVRFAVAIAAVWGLLYFVIASQPFKHWVETAVSRAIPGAITCATVRWGPSPWQISVTEGRIHGAHGETIIAVRGVRTRIDMARTLLGLVAFIDDPSKNPFPLYADFAEVLGGTAHIRLDEAGNIGILDAFQPPVDPGAPVDKTDTPLSFAIHAADAAVFDSGGTIEVPGFHLEASGLRARTDFHLTGPGIIAFSPSIVSVDNVSTYYPTFAHIPGDLRLDAHDVRVHGFRWRGLAFEWARVVAGLGSDRARSEGTLSSSGGMDVAPIEPTFFGSATLRVADHSPIGAWVTHGAVEGGFRASIEARGDLQRVDASFLVYSRALRIAGVDLGDVAVAGAFEPRPEGQIEDVHAVRIDSLQAEVASGQLSIHDLHWEPAGPGPYGGRRVSLELELSGASLDGLLALPWLREWGKTLPISSGRVNARIGLDLDPAPEAFRETMEVRVDALSVDGVASLVPGLAGDWAFSMGIRRETGPSAVRDSTLRPMDTVAVRELLLDHGEVRVRLAGLIDLGRETLSLEPYLRLGEIRELARTMGAGDLHGRVVLKAMSLSGPIRSPILRGVLNWTEARLDGQALGRVKAGIEFKDGWLHVKQLASDNAIGSLQLDGRIGLLLDGAPSQRLPFFIDRLRAERLNLERFTDRLGVGARLDIQASRIEGEASRPLETIRGDAKVRMDSASIGGERLRTLATVLSVTPGVVQASQIRAEFASGPVWEGRVELDRKTRAIRGAVTITPTSLASLAMIERELPSLSGLIEGELNIGGHLDAPTLIGSLGVVDLAWDEILIGSAFLNVQSLGRGQIDVSALDQGFFRGLTLRRATIEHEGFVPTRVIADIETDRLAPSDFLEALRSEQYRLAITSTLNLDLDLRRRTMAFALDAPIGGVRLSAPSRNLAWENRSPLSVKSDGRQVALAPVSVGMRGREGTPLQLCGSIDARGDLDVRVAGWISLGLLPWLDEAFSLSEGSLVVASLASDKPATPDSCFEGGTPELVLGGTLDKPRLEGAFVTRGIALMPRGSGRGIRIADGARVELRPGSARGDLDVVLPATKPLRADLDDGWATLHGRLEFRAFRPHAAHFSLVGTDLFIQSSGEFTATVSPKITIDATHLGGVPDLALAGEIVVSEGRFFKSFDVLSQALGGAFTGRGDVYSRSVFEMFPWFESTRLNLNVRADDFQIQTALPLARTDLPARFDLGITGTIAKPNVFRRVDLLAGGKLTYFVFERAFRVRQGALDFDGPPEAPIIDVTAQTTIAYLVRASTDALDEDEREVTVTLRVFGRVPDLKIELSADDATLDQADIQSLLLTGKPRGDLDRAQESRVVSADLAAVINGVLSAPFVKTASVGVGQKGAMEYRVGTCFAANLCFDTTTVAADAETTLRARFSLLLGDNLVCEGTLRRSDAATTTNQQTYQARCRYRIPLR